MAQAYTVRLPDGKEYGPADLEALQAWKAEGRIGPDTLVWREGATDWRPLSQVLETGELHADLTMGATVTVAPRPSPAAGVEDAEPTQAFTPADVPRPPIVLKPVEVPKVADVAKPVEVPRAAEVPKPAEVAKPAPAPRPRSAAAPPRTARRPPRSPVSLLPILVPLALLAAVGAGGFLWWRSGEPSRIRQRAEAEIRGFALPDRRFADDGLGLRLELPDGWIVLRPDSPFFHAPTAKLRLAYPRLGAFARLQAQVRPRAGQPLDLDLDRALDDWRLFADGLQEQSRSDVTVAGTPARKALVSWSADGQELRGAATVWRDGWNELALLAWGPGAKATEVNTATDALVSHLQMTGLAAAKIKAAADAVAPATPELSRSSVEALAEDRLAAGQPTDDLPQVSIRVVSRGLRALSAQESQEMGQIYSQVYKPLKEKERARLAAWLARVRSGATVAPEEGQAMRQALSDGLLALPEDIRARLQVLNEKAVAAALAQP